MQILKSFFSNRNNSARELSVFAESAMAVKRVVLQHMTINKEDDENKDPAKANEECGEKSQVSPPFGLSPPSESKLLQRRRFQSLNLPQTCSIRNPVMIVC